MRNKCNKLNNSKNLYLIPHFIPYHRNIQMSRDHPIAHKLTYHILQPSPPPCLRSKDLPIGKGSGMLKGIVLEQGVTLE